MTEEKAQSLIGRKVRGFKFDGKIDGVKYHYYMGHNVGDIGEIILYRENQFLVQFEDNIWSYPASLIEQHLVEEVNIDAIDSLKYATYGMDYGKSEPSEIEQLKTDKEELVNALKDFIHAIDSHKVILASEYEQAKQLIEKHGK